MLALTDMQVKLVKCLVDNIVVDISFQSLGGLCTVNFLESIDRRIDNHHLFKRSIILVRKSKVPMGLFPSFSDGILAASYKLLTSTQASPRGHTQEANAGMIV